MYCHQSILGVIESMGIGVIALRKYRMGQKQVYSYEYMKRKCIVLLHLYYYLLIIVLFSIQTTVNLHLPTPVYQHGSNCAQFTEALLFKKISFLPSVLCWTVPITMSSSSPIFHSPPQQCLICHESWSVYFSSWRVQFVCLRKFHCLNLPCLYLSF